ncbi:MAG TPA: response regulator transcription factor, partial [candidate division Zixibacteria bacterium]|nr:response regulator transcription factor [candidate division Zixibacteria bacterium]
MPEVGDALSERELVVLDRLADGSTNREIAQDLNISHNTVKVHLRNIFQKLSVSSRTEAITVAIQKGLLTVPAIREDTDQAAETAEIEPL